MTTYFVRFMAVPTLNSPDFGKLDGAHCIVWVLTNDANQASQKALQWAEKLGWQLSHMEETASTDRDFWLEDSLYLERFDRTQRDGICGVIESYKKDIPASN